MAVNVNNINLYDYNGQIIYPYIQLSSINIEEWDEKNNNANDFQLSKYIKACVSDNQNNNDYVTINGDQEIKGAKNFTAINSIINKAKCDASGNIITSTYVTKNDFDTSINDLNRRINDIENGSGNSGSTDHTCDLSDYTGDVSIKVNDHFNVNGNISVDGSISAKHGFFQRSDERLKTFKYPINVNLNELSTIKKYIFVFNDDLTNDHIGVSAQEIQKIYPEIVSTDKNGILNVDYSKLSVIALAAIDKLYQDNIKLNIRLKELESKIKIVKYKN